MSVIYICFPDTEIEENVNVNVAMMMMMMMMMMMTCYICLVFVNQGFIQQITVPLTSEMLAITSLLRSGLTGN